MSLSLATVSHPGGISFLRNLFSLSITITESSIPLVRLLLRAEPRITETLWDCYRGLPGPSDSVSGGGGGGAGYAASLNVGGRDLRAADEDKPMYFSRGRELKWPVWEGKEGVKRQGGRGVARGPWACGRVCFPRSPTRLIHQREKEETEPVCVFWKDVIMKGAPESN